MYNYYEAVYNDLKDYLNDNYTPEELFDMNEDSMVDVALEADEVTGNIYGYDYPEIVKEYVMDNLPLALEIAAEYCNSLTDLVKQGDGIYNYLDTTIRCNLVYGAAARYAAELSGDEEGVEE